jgi:small subunit ribosomal protein S9
MASAQASLRKAHVWPLPRELPFLQPPTSSWKSWELLNAKQLPMRAKGDYRALTALLNQLNHIRHVANVTGSHDVAEQVDRALGPFEHADRVAAAAAAEAARRKAMEEGAGIDELGRVFAMGRRKASSARVWMLPTAQASDLFETPAANQAAAAEDAEVEADAKPVAMPQGEVLVNHLPLPKHFSRVIDREAVVRPLRVTGLLGAYNIFALVRGGGPTGQAGAISLAVARALALIRKDAVPALINDNALHRDRRSVERKHTNRVKARKAVSIMILEMGACLEDQQDSQSLGAGDGDGAVRDGYGDVGDGCLYSSPPPICSSPPLNLVFLFLPQTHRATY